MGSKITLNRWALEVVIAWTLAALAVAQDDVRWAARYDGPAMQDDLPRSVVVDANGFVYVAGWAGVVRPPYPGSVHEVHMLTMKYSPQGHLVWARHFGNGRVINEVAHAIAVDDHGSVFVTGIASFPGSLKARFATLKYSSEGDLLWARESHTGPLPHGTGWDIELDGHGGVVVTGVGFVGTEDAYSLDIVTVRHDSDGEILWTRTLGSRHLGKDDSRALARCPDGSFVVTGKIATAPTAGGVGACDVVTIKYDINGRQEWVRTFDGLQSDKDTGEAVQTGPSGNIYVTGATQAHSKEWFGTDTITLAYSAEGDLLWSRRFNGPGSSADAASHIVVDEDENVFIAGSSVSRYGYYDLDYLVVGYDRYGGQLWGKTFTSSTGFPISDSLQGLVLRPNGDLLVTGSGTVGQWMTMRLAPSDGSVLWENNLNAPALALSTPYGGAALTPEGDLVIAGRSVAPTDWSNKDIMTIRLDVE